MSNKKLEGFRAVYYEYAGDYLILIGHYQHPIVKKLKKKAKKPTGKLNSL